MILRYFFICIWRIIPMLTSKKLIGTKFNTIQLGVYSYLFIHHWGVSLLTGSDWYSSNNWLYCPRVNWAKFCCVEALKIGWNTKQRIAPTIYGSQISSLNSAQSFQLQVHSIWPRTKKCKKIADKLYTGLMIFFRKRRIRLFTHFGFTFLPFYSCPLIKTSYLWLYGT